MLRLLYWSTSTLHMGMIIFLFTYVLCHKRSYEAVCCKMDLILRPQVLFSSDNDRIYDTYNVLLIFYFSCNFFPCTIIYYVRTRWCNHLISCYTVIIQISSMHYTLCYLQYYNYNYLLLIVIFQLNSQIFFKLGHYFTVVGLFYKIYPSVGS